MDKTQKIRIKRPAKSGQVEQGLLRLRGGRHFENEEDLFPKEEKTYQEETSKLDAVRGKKSSVRPCESEGLLKKEEKQQGEIGTSTDNIPSPCIFKSPFPNLEFQKPKLVSIGPYHRDEQHQLDKYKHSFLEKHRQKGDLRFYVEVFITLEKRARDCYSEVLVMSIRDFVEMMLVDACFIIELLRHFGGTENDLFPEDFNSVNIIMPWQIPILVQDLLLLENQIPFFVLELLFELSRNNEGKPDVSLTTMALKFFDLAFPRSSHFISEFCHLKANHLLDLFVKTIPPLNPWNMSNFLGNRNSDLQDSVVKNTNSANTAAIPKETKFHPPSLLDPPPSFYRRKALKLWKVRLESENMSVPLDKTVAELLQAGIEFRPSRSNSFLDFNFQDGMLKIPLVTVNNLFSTILVNSAALEYCSAYDDVPRPVANYIYFMSCLIKKAEDVQFLCSKGIISRLSNNDERLADLFNLLRTYVSLDGSDSHFWKTIREIQSYNGRSRKPMRQFLMETCNVLVWCCVVAHTINGSSYVLPRMLLQFFTVFGIASWICLLSLQQSRRLLKDPVQLTLIISTFVLLLLSYLGYKT